MRVFTCRHASLADVPERQGERRTYRLKRVTRKTPEYYGERLAYRLKRASRYTPSPVSECHERGAPTGLKRAARCTPSPDPECHGKMCA